MFQILHKITWKEYIITMSVLSLLYYAWFLFKYYSTTQLVNGLIGKGVRSPFRSSEQRPAAIPEPDVIRHEVTAGAVPDGLPELFQELISEMENRTDKAAADKMVEEEIKFSLQELLDKEKYRPLRGTDLQRKISEQIDLSLINKCSIHLDAKGLAGLWVR